jgi:hypothetical protein
VNLPLVVRAGGCDLGVDGRLGVKKRERGI